MNFLVPEAMGDRENLLSLGWKSWLSCDSSGVAVDPG